MFVMIHTQVFLPVFETLLDGPSHGYSASQVLCWNVGGCIAERKPKLSAFLLPQKKPQVLSWKAVLMFHHSHMKIAALVSADLETGPITVQSVVRPTILENPQNFVSLIKSSEGETFLDRWLVQLNKDAIRKRVAKSDVVYLDQDADAKEVKQHVAA